MDTQNEETRDEVAGTADDSLREENEALRRELRVCEERMTRLESDLAAREEELAGLRESLQEATERTEEMEKGLAQTVAAYREMVVQANPGILGELITGETVEEVDASLAKARALMERARQEIEAEAARTRVPVGSPPRGLPDLSGLSAREKIQYAIGGN